MILPDFFEAKLLYTGNLLNYCSAPVSLTKLSLALKIGSPLPKIREGRMRNFYNVLTKIQKPLS